MTSVQLAEASNLAVYATMITLTLAMVAFAVAFAAGRTTSPASAATEAVEASAVGTTAVLTRTREPGARVGVDPGRRAANIGMSLTWLAFGVTLYAGLSMVTNAPFYSFKVVGGRRSVPFVVLVGVALGIALIALDTPRALFGIFCLYGLSGYGVYAWRKFKGKPVSVIATSIDEPDEKGLHH